jgi:hypothetical protein
VRQERQRSEHVQPVHSIQVNSIKFNSIKVNSIKVNSIKMQITFQTGHADGAQVLLTPFHRHLSTEIKSLDHVIRGNSKKNSGCHGNDKLATFHLAGTRGR